MFDFEEQIRSWRANVTNALGNRCDAIDELECHLRDDFERLTREGRSAEHAWQEALRRLGTAEQLASEFHKDRSPRWWAPTYAVTGLGVIMLGVGWMASRLFLARRDPLLAAHVFAVSVGYASVFTVGFLSLWAIVTRALERWDATRDAALRAAGARLGVVATIATALGTALGTQWAHTHLGRWWAWDPRELGGLAVLGWSLLLLRAFRARATTTQLLLLLGVMGNLVVALSWLGPVLIESVHAYGFSTAGMVLGLFMASQMIAIYVGLSRPDAVPFASS